MQPEAKRSLLRNQDSAKLAPLIQFVAFVCFAMLLAGFRAGSTTGLDIIKENKNRYEVSSAIELIKSVTIDRKGNITTQEVLYLAKTPEDGGRATLFRFREPPEITGVALLSKSDSAEGDMQYLFMPAFGRVRKIAGSGQKGYFMGTDFAFEDLQPENTSRYEYERGQDDYLDDIQCFRVTARPASDKAKKSSGYAKRELWISRKDYRILKVDFYKTESQLIKTLVFSEFEPVPNDDSLVLPRRLEMKHHVRKTASIFAVTKCNYNVPLPLDYFSEEAISNWKTEYDAATLSTLE